MTMERIKFVFFLIMSYGISQLLQYTAYWPIAFWLTTFPGTFLHEAMHYICALILNGSPTGFSVFPTWGENGMETLGHVMFVSNWYNAAAVSLAPLILAPMSVWFNFKAASASSWKWMAWWLYVSSCAWLACMPSGQDWNNAWERPVSLLLMLILVALPIGIKAKKNIKNVVNGIKK